MTRRAASTLCIATCLLAGPLAAQVSVTGDLGTAAGTAFGAARFAFELRPTPSWLVEPVAQGARVGADRWFGLAGARGAYARGDVEAWVRLAGGRVAENAPSTNVLLAGAGASLRRRGITIHASLGAGRIPHTLRLVTVTPPPIPIDSGGSIQPPPELRRVGAPGRLWREVSGRVEWRQGRFEASVAGGAHFELAAGGRARRWAAVDANWWITPRIGVLAGLASRGRPLLEVGTGGPHGPLRLALRAALGPAPRSIPGLAARPAGADARLRALRVYLPRAQRVELTGDFLEWRIVPLRRLYGGMWEARLAIPAGMHRVNIRIDSGPWIVPPGLPAVADDFSGAAGVLQVR